MQSTSGQIRPAEHARRKRTCPGDMALSDRGAPHLVIVAVDSGSLRTVPLAEGSNLVIGRTDSADIYLSDPLVSREHAKLVVTSISIEIVDLGSRNGTLVNGQAITGARQLHVQDVIRVGRSLLTLECLPCSDGTQRTEREATEVDDREEQAVRVGDQAAVIAGPVLAQIFARVGQFLAASDMPVLICGETGSGKSLVASALHHWSPRRTGPLVILNCAAIPELLIESELFGHARGAFTGADLAKAGLIDTARGGTLVLDEIGDLPLTAQAKLLRALETKCVLPLGDLREHVVDVRLVAVSSRDLGLEGEDGRFRKDLLFRLNGATLWIPPLRERQGEIPTLACRFLETACQRLGRASMEITSSATELLVRHPWPGNVRELERLMQYAAMACPDPELDSRHLHQWWTATGPTGWAWGSEPRGSNDPAATSRQLPTPGSCSAFRPLRDEVRELEQARIAVALEAAQGNQRRAAELLQIPLRTLARKLRELCLSSTSARPRSRSPQR